MSGLERVSFKQGRTKAPRLSAPYVPGVHSSRFWTDAEKDVVKRYYPTGGSAACLAHLGPHRTPSGVYQQAKRQLLTFPQGMADYKGVNGKVEVPADIDDILRREYELQDGKKRGAINAIADKLHLPRWWVTTRAIKLGLTMPHKKEPPWTAAEEALLHKVPLHDLERSARMFREHGFQRSPSAIKVKATRLDISRRFREGFSAGQAAAVVGFDGKIMATYCIEGACRATRRADNRLPQQGGARWVITREDLRSFVLEHLGRIDLRKVDKLAFVQLIADEPLERETPAIAPPAPKPEQVRFTASELRDLGWLDKMLRGKSR